MNIIFDTENIDQIKNNNILLELDTFYFAKLHKTSTAYCVVDNIRLTEFDKIEQHQRLHADMISAYKNKDFKLCQDLQEHLIVDLLKFHLKMQHILFVIDALHVLTLLKLSFFHVCQLRQFLCLF